MIYLAVSVSKTTLNVFICSWKQLYSGDLFPSTPYSPRYCLIGHELKLDYAQHVSVSSQAKAKEENIVVSGGSVGDGIAHGFLRTIPVACAKASGMAWTMVLERLM